MKIDNTNRSQYENTDVVSRDGLELDDNMGDIVFKSLWVKGDIIIPQNSRIVVVEEILRAGEIKSLGGWECNEDYKGKTFIEELDHQQKMRERFPYLSKQDIESMSFR